MRLALMLGLAVPFSTLLLAVLGAHWPTALYLPAMCLVLALADLSMLAPPSMVVRVRVGQPVHLGTGSKAEIEIGPPAALARPLPLEAALEFSGPALNLAETFAQGTLWREPLTLSLRVAPHRRGLLTVDKVWLRWRGPLGLCQARRVERIDLTFPVLQNIVGIHRAALTFFHREADAGQKSQPFKGEGSEFDSLMDFSLGMDNRLIDWKHSARHRKLLAKEFRQERNHQIVLGFDTGRLLTEPVGGVPKLDHFIRSGLLLAWVSLMSGDMVGACGFDLCFRSYLKPGRGRAFFARLQRFASELDYRTEETNFTVGLTELKSRLPHRSLIVIFTEFIDAVAAELLVEGLALLARRHTVIFVTTPDPLLGELRDARPRTVHDLASAVIADGFQRDRAIVLQRAARHGVHCLDVPPGAMSAAILNRYLFIKQRGLL